MTIRLKNSWSFFTDSLLFLYKNPGLLVFPLFSLLSLGVMYGFYVLYTWHHFNQLVDLNQNHKVLLVVILFILYLIISFIFLFFNAAFVTCVMQRMQGEKGRIGEGLLLALKKIGPLFVWSLVNSTVCLLLNAIERVHSVFAKTLHGILGFSWSITSGFVLPVMVAQNIGPIKAFKYAIKLVGRSFRTCRYGFFGCINNREYDFLPCT